MVTAVPPWGMTTDVEVLADVGDTVDEYGQPIPVWQVVDVVRGVVRDTEEEEITRGTETLVVNGKLWVFTRRADALTGYGRIRAWGREYHIEGAPRAVRDGVGVHHLEARLRSVEEVS